MTNRSAKPPAIPDHELICCIGDGSYGEVWLARNAMGTLRAVKIVQRASFQDERPCEREFTGLKHFEPVSRAHEGLVDILQLGRNDAAGFFYYVMELADDAAADQRSDGVLEKCGDGSRSEPHQSTNPPIHHPTPYSPLTLESRIRAERRIPVKDCVTIGAALADALGHLHEAGRVHRDIKPSNIISVGGIPKLADVGLVAWTDSARTFVGTEGFVPPEGPGTPRADIYSLGKCLYEMAMGKDRQAFPSPPMLLDEFPDRAELLELNEVITKACDPEPSRRYRSAAQLTAGLKIIRAGQSVERSRRRRKLKRIALAFAAVVGASALVWLLRKPSLEIVREFPMPGNWPAQGALLGHYYGPSSMELFAAINGGLAVVTLEGVPLPARTIAGRNSDRFDLDLLADTDGDGRDEAFVGWREGTNLHLSVLNQNFVDLHTFEATGSATQATGGLRPISHLAALKFLPAKTGRPPLLLAGLHTGTTPTWPRSVRLYNFTNQTLLGEFEFPANPVAEVVALEDDQANRQFILGTQSHNNHAKGPDGTDDEHSYLYALSEDKTNRLWTFPAGPHHTQTAPVLATIGGTNYIFAAVCRQFESYVEAGGATNAWHPYLLKLDPANGQELRRFTTSSPILSLTVAELDGTGSPVVLAPCADGSILVLDTDLHLLRQVPVVTKLYDWVNLRIIAVQDLDHDKQPEVVLSSSQIEFISGTNTTDPEGPANDRRLHENAVLVLDHKLQPLARRVIHARERHTGLEVLVATDQARNTIKILALDHTVTVLRFKRR